MRMSRNETRRINCHLPPAGIPHPSICQLLVSYQRGCICATDYEKLRKELQEIRETLTKKENPAPPLVVEEKRPNQEAPKPPPLIVRRNKLSQAPLHAKPILPASTNAPVKKNE
jgi:hypothetical protein